MAGLVPAIHVVVSASVWRFAASARRGCPAQGRAWRRGLLASRFKRADERDAFAARAAPRSCEPLVKPLW